MGSIEFVSQFPVLVQILAWISKYWIMPAGMVALYYYGRFHFNTPDYALDLVDGNGAPIDQAGRLISMAPPSYTTSHTRFERYALRYVLILEAGFFVLVFMADVIDTAQQILQLKLPTPPSSATLQYRALFALFALTGLLSSFPVLKEIDGWLLKTLHQAALIPDEARRLADQLFESPFSPREKARADVRSILSRRDTIAVAEEHARGELEDAVLKMLWLKSALNGLTTASARYSRFRSRLERDLNEIARLTESLRPDLIAYLQQQESLIPDGTDDIDGYLAAHSDNNDIRYLTSRRAQLQRTCNALFRRLCMITALLVYSTDATPEAIGQTLQDLGFDMEVRATPSWDWDTVFKVTASLFIVILAMNMALIALLALDSIKNEWTESLTRSRLFSFSLVGTLTYAIVLLLAIRFKRRWMRQPDGSSAARPENLLIAIYSYLAVVICYVIFQYWLRGFVTTAPLLLAVTNGVAGYFAGRYIDRAMQGVSRSNLPASLQGSLQALATFLAIFFAPAPPGAAMTSAQLVVIALYGALQSAVIGFVMGVLFQRLYRRTEFTERRSEVTMLGDIAFQPRLAR